MTTVGIVVVGRNEGERLRSCLLPIARICAPSIYVDSGSSDGSAAMAASIGVEVHELDPSLAFSAARARNEGFTRLMRSRPELSLVQFVDGDCELFPGWLEIGAACLASRPEVVAVCGRVNERNPNASIYNRLCAMEWQKIPGPIDACGGNLMVRVNAFRDVGGFRSDVIAAEDDELCLRLRRRGTTILHLDADMVWHDVAMTRFSQWWVRARRSGHAYAQGATLHGRGPERHFVRDCRRIWFWGLVLPAASLGLAWPTSGLSLALLAAYPLQAARIYRGGRRRGWPPPDAAAYAAFTLLAKFPGLTGMLRYHWRRRLGKDMTIIEHKGAGANV